VELQPPRGTDDLLPPRSEAMLGLYEAAHATARLFGYRFLEEFHALQRYSEIVKAKRRGLESHLKFT